MEYIDLCEKHDADKLCRLHMLFTVHRYLKIGQNFPQEGTQLNYHQHFGQFFRK